MGVIRETLGYIPAISLRKGVEREDVHGIIAVNEGKSFGFRLHLFLGTIDGTYRYFLGSAVELAELASRYRR